MFAASRSFEDALHDNFGHEKVRKSFCLTILYIIRTDRTHINQNIRCILLYIADITKGNCFIICIHVLKIFNNNNAHLVVFILIENHQIIKFL
jgi:hypothetical protein